MTQIKAITFLGVNPIETCYVFPDGSEFVAPFFGVALAQYVSNLQQYVARSHLINA